MAVRLPARVPIVYGCITGPVNIGSGSRAAPSVRGVGLLGASDTRLFQLMFVGRAGAGRLSPRPARHEETEGRGKTSAINSTPQMY